MSNNNIARPITMTKGFLVFIFHQKLVYTPEVFPAISDVTRAMRIS